MNRFEFRISDRNGQLQWTSCTRNSKTMLVSGDDTSNKVQRQEKQKCRKIINKKSSKFVYKKRKLLGLAATEPLDCAICLLEFEHGDKGRKIESCSHMFHGNCLNKWLMHGKGQGTCPLCRSVIIPENMVEGHRKVEDEGLAFTFFEEELALLLLSGLSSGCRTQGRF
uniref:RING-H2 finger protein ATL46-like n=1 Tax=Nicotiana tabacum TaxID=4097 RepID=A0A1S3ZZN3_TOBAC|nr:PREDICTED: RING-H2 finger protein ATL46-like [Nicotiana tabacum]